MESQQEDEQMLAGIKRLPCFSYETFECSVCLTLSCAESHEFAGRQQILCKSGTCCLLSELPHLPVLFRPLFVKVKCPYL